MYIWNELSLPVGKKDGYRAMVGDSLGANSPATTLYVPLEFWFCRNVGLSLPLIALTDRAKKHLVKTKHASSQSLRDCFEQQTQTVRENPKAIEYQGSHVSANWLRHTLRYGNNLMDNTMDNPQPNLAFLHNATKVQRLNGFG
jgi:hypothetical protein